MDANAIKMKDKESTTERQKMGARIKELREQQGMTQQDLADKTGLQRSNIARIESGKYSTGQDILSKIAEALGKKLDFV
jgi:transcriptional regulator with XRE-family HTH domain